MLKNSLKSMRIYSTLFQPTTFGVALAGGVRAEALNPVRIHSSKMVKSGSRTFTFQRIEPPAPKGLAAFQGLEDLHRHFGANREELIAQAAANEQRQREHAAFLKANLPVPQKTTFRFWSKTPESAIGDTEGNP